MKDALQVNSFDELLLRDAGISWNRVIAVSFRHVASSFLSSWRQFLVIIIFIVRRGGRKRRCIQTKNHSYSTCKCR